VTTSEETPTLTTKNALRAPQAKQATMATTQAKATFQWWRVTSTGTVVAAIPMIEAIDRSNSPTERW